MQLRTNAHMRECTVTLQAARTRHLLLAAAFAKEMCKTASDSDKACTTCTLHAAELITRINRRPSAVACSPWGQPQRANSSHLPGFRLPGWMCRHNRDQLSCWRTTDLATGDCVL